MHNRRPLRGQNKKPPFWGLCQLPPAADIRRSIGGSAQRIGGCARRAFLSRARYLLGRYQHCCSGIKAVRRRRLSEDHPRVLPRTGSLWLSCSFASCRVLAQCIIDRHISHIVAMKPTNKAKEAHCGDICGGGRSGVGGAKDGGQGEYAPAKHALGSEPGSRDTDVGAYTAAFAVKHPRWEPYAGKPHVRFWAGGVR